MNRIDVIEGYYWFFTNYHGGQFSDMYARLCRIAKYFTPSPIDMGPSTDGAKEVYYALVARREAEGGI